MARVLNLPTLFFGAVFSWHAGTAAVSAGELTIAVAANFNTVARQIAAAFESDTEHKVTLSIGSTGTLYAQIAQGAPFDIFLAADRVRPERAIEAGHAVSGSRFTYAIGRLALFAANRAVDEADFSVGAFDTLAIANPSTAPYGQAAVETLQALGLYSDIADRLVRGQNVGQALQFVVSGNADLGLVALTQTIDFEPETWWLVPETLHAPIAQDAVLLTHGAENPAALGFLDFLRSADARAIMAQHGYGPGS